MPARDTFHDVVVEALKKDGWTITHDPFRLEFGQRDVYADLGAERSIGAERGSEKILVEIKSFIGKSDIAEFEKALGQFILYRLLLEDIDPKRKPYLAIPQTTYESLFNHLSGLKLIKEVGLNLFSYSLEAKRIIQWWP